MTLARPRRSKRRDRPVTGLSRVKATPGLPFGRICADFRTAFDLPAEKRAAVEGTIRAVMPSLATVA